MNYLYHKLFRLQNKQNPKADEKQMLNELQKVYKYRWHSLESNPKDLPNESTQVYICVKVWNYDDVWYEYAIAFQNGGKWNLNGLEIIKYCAFEVVGWKEIEPYRANF